MTQTVFEKMKTAISVLKLDFTTEEFATFADDQELSEEAIEAVQTVFPTSVKRNSRPPSKRCSN